MRESIGGAMMLRIILIVIVLFVCILCISANFAKAFRVKNGVIDIIEQYQGVNKNSIPRIEEYLARMAYNCKSSDYTKTINYVLKDKDGLFYGEYYGKNSAGSFTTILGDNDDTSIENRSYNIQVCIDWNVLGAGGTWTIAGKTEVIKGAIYS